MESQRDEMEAGLETKTTGEGPGHIDRRGFLKTIGVVGATLASAGAAKATETKSHVDRVGVLVDTTRCVGCRTCEYMCAEANGLPEPDLMDDTVFDAEREGSESQRTVVNRYETDAGEIYVKRQCMHCIEPACASACLTKAMAKTEMGPVIWRGNKCMGCRFCMVSCPFDAPKFEYHSANPKIQKCTLCWERLEKGELPACVENCPAGALTFGKRDELIEEARRRINDNPDAYIHEIFGEDEVGGTSWLYLSAAPFDQIGFRTDLGDTAYPKYTQEFLYGVPIVLTLLPPFLLALSSATKGDNG
jgi:formate dehydrogenase iron-sulfur subunit